MDVIGPGDLDRIRTSGTAVGGRRGGVPAVVLLPPLVARRHGDVNIGQFTEVRVGIDEASGLPRFEQPNVVNLCQDGFLAVIEGSRYDFVLLLGNCLVCMSHLTSWA